MKFTAAELGKLLNGIVEGEPGAEVSAVSKIEDAQEGSLTFLANPKYAPFLYSTNASIVIVGLDLLLEKPVTSTLIRVKDPYSAFSVLLDLYNSSKLNKTGREEPNFISPSAEIGEECYIGAFSYIGHNVKLGKNVKVFPQVYLGDNCVVGDNSVLYAGVKIYSDCLIGSRVIVHSGTVIGSDGFGFAPQPDGSYSKVSQIGNVVIEDDVEIGSNNSIDRATMGSTIIGKGVKLDNLIQVAHNVEIGKNTVIASQTGISGSTKIGENSVIGGQVGIVGHISLAKGTQINAKSGISKSITEEGKQWNGSPALAFRESLRIQAVYRRLPELENKIALLEKQLLERGGSGEEAERNA
ncbi:UDP-3-O-[3-hydroxymyristoyl] glucosamine N-acyltransferase [Anseongella ginsenosidimutans]|uniref:UDP-3-O-acylglucosamine N-acyltransferase n=1 Tax=Anseongella ginsenosidimutans TaxID=496056 RepID=A0A4R3KW75_9SPHI|nr:UDP-3-O-(3-hydroxymyristoyl)glucosamine N-acyltransferase [Anseongella ginsenosidimutans]QEC51439.1 UDP-3-O-(3-hydroxymyristoyl)glucosamine N-acyltransferase [Anseongella ginsenosidimutans]TCS89855.1 UDP-3-O-[3-hydroxymyristoyl] glucosamine N-acyltransferase [Anseongella ginsenosidimutans]